ncbi:MAG TPA: hypothetical protein VE093_03530 [Polyangiaceae bacterium]|jgi:hypothetical protein|nr:hypothetical protein [Polyangiaceae bacterium]
MSAFVPTIEMLQAYARGDLAPEEEDTVRRWLLVRGDTSALLACYAAQDAIEQRSAQLAYWAARPIRAGLARALRRACARLLSAAEGLTVVVAEARAPAVAALGRRPLGEPDAPIEVTPGQIVDLRLRMPFEGRVAVFAVTSWTRLDLLLADERPRAAGEDIELPGVEVDMEDESVELYAVFSRTQALPLPEASDSPEWLARLLTQIADRSDMSVLHRALVPALQIHKGKQDL